MLPVLYQLPAAVLLVAGGLLSCFLGYRIFRLVLGIYGFVIGAIVTSSLMEPASSTMTALAMLGGGLLGALVLVAAAFVGVVLIGAASAAVLVHFAAAGLGSEPPALLLIAFTIAGALAALAAQHYVIVLCTAFGGAWLTVMGGLGLALGQAGTAPSQVFSWSAYPLRPATGQGWAIWVWLVVGLVGTLIQLRLTARASR
jgi:hypothetical protein